MRAAIRSLGSFVYHGVGFPGILLVGVCSFALLLLTLTNPYPFSVAAAAINTFSLLTVLIGSRSRYASYKDRNRTLQERIEAVDQRLATLRMAHGETTPPTFCGDCGQRYIPWKHQNGFDPTTGDPIIETTMACPDWSPELEEDRMQRRYRSRLLGALAEPSYACGNRKVTEIAAHAHNHPAETDVSASCLGCIDRMVKEGVISRDDAKRMMELAS